jgi:hypothetical protein
VKVSVLSPSLLSAKSPVNTIRSQSVTILKLALLYSVLLKIPRHGVTRVPTSYLVDFRSLRLRVDSARVCRKLNFKIPLEHFLFQMRNSLIPSWYQSLFIAERSEAYIGYVRNSLARSAQRVP